MEHIGNQQGVSEHVYDNSWKCYPEWKSISAKK